MQRAASRGNQSRVSEIVGTSLDSRAELDALARLEKTDPAKRGELINRAIAGENVSAHELARTAARTADKYMPRHAEPVAETLTYSKANRKELRNALATIQSLGKRLDRFDMPAVISAFQMVENAIKERLKA